MWPSLRIFPVSFKPHTEAAHHRKRKELIGRTSPSPGPLLMASCALSLLLKLRRETVGKMRWTSPVYRYGNMNTNLCVLPTLMVTLGRADVSMISLPRPEEVVYSLIHIRYEWNNTKMWETDIYYLKSTIAKNKNYFGACWFRKAYYSFWQSHVFSYNSSQLKFFKYSYLIFYLHRLIGWVSYYRQMKSKTIIITFKIF